MGPRRVQSLEMLRSALILCLLGLSFAEDPLKLVSRVWTECSESSDMGKCLGAKAVAFADRAARADFIPLGDSLSFVKTPSAFGREGKALDDNEVEEAGRQGTLHDLFFDRVSRFFNSHTVKFDLPKVSPQDLKTGMEEGRGKMKKMMGMMMMGGAMKLMAIVPMAILGLFLIAGKALLISKIALVLSLIMVLKKLMMSKMNDHDHSSGGHGGGGWDRRSFNSASHDLAYSAQKQ